MSDKTLEELLKEIEPNFNSHIEKGTIEMSIEYYNLLEERMIRLLNENKQLKEDKKKAREFIYRYWITYDESKNFTEFNEEMNILIKDIKKLLEILGDKE